MPAEKTFRSDWMCISCGRSLGRVLGGEFYPNVDGANIRTNGPNLTVTCPDCGSVKTWYTSDPVVRAVYQLVEAVAEVSARAMIEQMGRAVRSQKT
jgi:ribosomal protein S27E